MFKRRLLVEEGRKAGHTFSQPDLIIAATAPFPCSTRTAAAIGSGLAVRSMTFIGKMTSAISAVKFGTTGREFLRNSTLSIKTRHGKGSSGRLGLAMR